MVRGFNGLGVWGLFGGFLGRKPRELGPWSAPKSRSDPRITRVFFL